MSSLSKQQQSQILNLQDKQTAPKFEGIEKSANVQTQRSRVNSTELAKTLQLDQQNYDHQDDQCNDFLLNISGGLDKDKIIGIKKDNANMTASMEGKRLFHAVDSTIDQDYPKSAELVNQHQYEDNKSNHSSEEHNLFLVEKKTDASASPCEVQKVSNGSKFFNSNTEIPPSNSQAMSISSNDVTTEQPSSLNKSHHSGQKNTLNTQYVRNYDVLKINTKLIQPSQKQSDSQIAVNIGLDQAQTKLNLVKTPDQVANSPDFVQKDRPISSQKNVTESNLKPKKPIVKIGLNSSWSDSNQTDVMNQDSKISTPPVNQTGLTAISAFGSKIQGQKNNKNSMFQQRMKNKKKNLGGLNFLLPTSKSNIETVKEVQENEGSSVKQKENSKGDDSKGDHQSSIEKTIQELKSPALNPLKFIQISSKQLYRQYDEQELKPQFNKIFECGKKIGEGLHSSVYICYKKQDQERICPFAVKVTGFDDIEQQLAQKKEYDILSQLDHENIIKVYDYFHNEMSNQQYQVMQYVDGIELLDMLHMQETVYSEYQARQLFIQILNGLVYLHDKQIVHRDIKPSNLLVRKIDNRVFIIDFNVARKHDQKKEVMKSNTGVVQFSAPEMFTSEPYTNKVDVWSAGIILYMMLGGVQPFQHDNLQKLVQMIQKEEPDYELQAFKQVDPSAIDLLRKMLSKEADKRPTAQECLQSIWLREDDSDSEKPQDLPQNILKSEKRNQESKISSLEIAATNLSYRYQQKMNKTLCISQKIKVKDLKAQLIKDGIDNKLDYLIHQYNENIDKHQEFSESNAKIRKIFGFKQSKSAINLNQYYDIDNYEQQNNKNLQAENPITIEGIKASYSNSFAQPANDQEHGIQFQGSQDQENSIQNNKYIQEQKIQKVPKFNSYNFANSQLVKYEMLQDQNQKIAAVQVQDSTPQRKQEQEQDNSYKSQLTPSRNKLFSDSGKNKTMSFYDFKKMSEQKTIKSSLQKIDKQRMQTHKHSPEIFKEKNVNNKINSNSSKLRRENENLCEEDSDNENDELIKSRLKQLCYRRKSTFYDKIDRNEVLGLISSPEIQREKDSNSYETTPIQSAENGTDKNSKELSKQRAPSNFATPQKNQESCFSFNFTLKTVEIVPQEEVLNKLIVDQTQQEPPIELKQSNLELDIGASIIPEVPEIETHSPTSFKKYQLKRQKSQLSQAELNSPTLSRKSISKIENVPPPSQNSLPLIKKMFSAVRHDQAPTLNDHFDLNIKMDEDYKLTFISPKNQEQK